MPNTHSTKATGLNKISSTACEQPVHFPRVTMIAILTITAVSNV